MKKRFNGVFVVASAVIGLTFSLQAAAQVGDVPNAKIAVIYTDKLLDEKGGIAKVKTLSAFLNREFQPRQVELQALQNRITGLKAEIENMQDTADPNTIRSKRDLVSQLNMDLKRKGEDAEAAYSKRRAEVFLPFQDQVGRALEAYAKARNIDIIIDGSQTSLAYASVGLDITQAFINDFNSKNP